MKKLFILMLACVPMLCPAAGKSASATMEVSFTVVEACSVQGSANAAQVNCAQQTPYQIQTRPAAAPAAKAIVAAANAEPLTIYF